MSRGVNVLEAIRPEPSVLQRASKGGPIVLGGLALLVISALLFLAWLYIFARRRRLFPILAGVAVGLGLLGYVAYDWRYLSLNLAMRDAQSVREDCAQLLERRSANIQDDFQELHLHGSELPASLTHLGATFVRVTRNNVQISMTPYSALTGSAWGFLYDPKRAYLTDGWPADVRPTWYRDFYEFTVYGE